MLRDSLSEKVSNKSADLKVLSSQLFFQHLDQKQDFFLKKSLTYLARFSCTPDNPVSNNLMGNIFTVFNMVMQCFTSEFDVVHGDGHSISVQHLS